MRTINRLPLLLPIIFLFSSASAQQTTEVKTEIVSSNNYELSVIRVYPDSFPEVAVVFQAQNELGMPIWEMGTDEMNVEENETPCEVIETRNISKEIPVNIGLVLDASGSMSNVSPKEFERVFGPNFQDSLRSRRWGLVPYDYDSRPWRDALDHAKLGLETFLTEESLGNDFIQLVVFSQKVLSAIPLTSDPSIILNAVDTVKPTMGTAFYDALMESMHMLDSATNEKVLVALTDGGDNESTATVSDVIQLANEKNVRIYVIGLGNAFTQPLLQIAEQTDGFFYYTEEPEQLSEIYRTIKKKIKSVYQLKYVSEHDDPDDTSPNVRFSFVNDTLKFLNNAFETELPAEAIEYIKRQDQLRQLRNVMIPVGAIGLIGLTVFLIRLRKIELTNIKTYPNPFTDSFTVDFEQSSQASPITEVQVFDSSNQLVPLSWSSTGPNQIQVSLNRPTTGLHLVVIKTANASSKPEKVLRKN